MAAAPHPRSPLSLLFRIKICGVTSPTDAQNIVLAGADAIGLNFFAPSPRAVSEAQALRIVEPLPSHVARVGVFVNHPRSDVLRLAETLELDWIQLHGDEPPEVLEEYADYQIIRAFRCRDRGGDAVLSYLAQCRHQPNAVLIDAYAAGSYGGTGQVVDWDAARAVARQIAPIPLILAGGLQPENVAAAIAAVHPQAVDTASGVEIAPGQKATEQVNQFVEQAQTAFAD
ncbi:MAG TPA: phosphoribosylanthranilate isomerase [Planctomycetaceae bacterium]|mgnify:CR=1 FL=1|nr:phosphoribosylanthranilate isomerase [Blastopirellula sp.]HAY80868.1 phosphoribosylanthranilate isomerase [Planctomycetaceae bacterium]